ncbi:WXG100 family type VII secretion target [Agromyces intestinalis]|uniref:ESAT-6-like protein n=1 Tax=Agromyces intestinalis TaxID=2592652 RepID=A0A5C1YI92_9MICO|nr:WXG100 family type VII secretion target [Agromyces intestinalis]QEO15318.1 WXG100 family type VII secretion target [Agromyces intestinalis]
MTVFHVDSEQVRAATQSTQAAVSRVQAEVDALMGRLTALQQSWSGQASTAFQGAVADWRATHAQVEEHLAALSHALGVAATQYVDAEQANTRLFLR